jgi:predicted NAD/FAD-binding protein
MGQRIAIVGSGIAGLGAAWALHRDNDITVFEANDRIGGHANTVDVEMGDRSVSVDTGFIVYNEVTYPNLTRLLALLGVETEPSDMSFAYSRADGFEYGASLGGVLARPRNLISGRFLRMLGDINRFRREGAALVPRPGDSIEDLLRARGYSDGFLEDYLYPMAGAIWSTPQSSIGRFPARPLLDFLRNHGLIEIVGRPQWRTVTGGSRRYVAALSAGFVDRIRTGTPVRAMGRRQDGVTVATGSGIEEFDQVVLATHSDQALRILGDDASGLERRMLSAIPYRRNLAVLHSDDRLMPRNPRIWSSWNAMARTTDGEAVSVSYWMNRLQNLKTPKPLMVSLNPISHPDPMLVHGTYEYDHPQFDRAAVDAQRQIADAQGLQRTWFAGAYLGYGFHEDGLQAGLDVAAALGSPAPWRGAVDRASSVVAPVRVAA